jgi:hypothetical protein
VTRQYPFRVSVETNPAQTDDVRRAIEEVLEAADQAPDPWWQAGNEEALEE